MSRQRPNTQLFALSHPPLAELTVRGYRYRLLKVFKHDFFAATALYEAMDASAPWPKLVIKAGREQVFCGMPLDWIGQELLKREQRAHERLDGVPGVQRWVAQLSETAYALEFIEGRTLDTLEAPPPPLFFEKLREMLDAIHARRAAYCDLNKRSNIVVQENGEPALIDFQVTEVEREFPTGKWARLLAPFAYLQRRYLSYLQHLDLYHLYKHKRRLLPEALTPEEEKLSLRQGRIVRLHRRLVTPMRQMRRNFLTRQHQSGRLVSPSAHLEDHDQPEKETWRKDN